MSSGSILHEGVWECDNDRVNLGLGTPDSSNVHLRLWQNLISFPFSCNKQRGDGGMTKRLALASHSLSSNPTSAILLAGNLGEVLKLHVRWGILISSFVKWRYQLNFISLAAVCIKGANVY